MDLFSYRTGELCCEDVPAARVAAAVGTPTYVYSAGTLGEHYRRLSAAFAPVHPLICFSVKSCPNIHVLRLLAGLGAGMDVVSLGELHRARLAGVPGDRIVFAGVGKADHEVAEALAGADPAAPRPRFNVESSDEYEAIAAHARAVGVRAQAAVRLNPGIDAGGHAYIRTGTNQTKFGVPADEALRLLALHARDPALPLTGVHVHLGSSITTPAPYVEGVRAALDLIDQAAARGARIDTLDLGGGFAADYRTGEAPPASVFADAIVPLLRERVAAGLRILLEPGRTIAASAGVLLTRVLYVKRHGEKTFVVCDAGMNTLIRPSLYDAFHFIWPTRVPAHLTPPRRAEVLDLPGLVECDVVGPICETGDFLARDRALPPVARGDLLAVFTAGAYGMSMASRYNSHPLPAEVLVDGGRALLIRERETLGDLVAHERERVL